MTTPGHAPRPALGTPTRSWGRLRVSDLPSWPFTATISLFPLWWAMGVVDVVIIPAALIMAMYLCRCHDVRVPRFFIIWLGFLAFMLGSVTRLTRASEYITFSYRAAIYISATVLLIYVFNAKRHLPDGRVLKQIVIYWVTTLAGAVLGILSPTGALRTPAYYAVNNLFPGLLRNDLVRDMVVRQFSGYSPDNYFQAAPRPTAPFLFTNQWGNVYSLLLPLVLLFAIELGPNHRIRRVLFFIIPLSAIPAMLTLNRGMMIGLGIAAIYAGVRFSIRRNIRGIIACVGLLAVGALLWFILPIQDRLSARTGSSTSTRLSLYAQAWDAATSSPLFGYGVPIHSDDPAVPAVGTQGQFWVLLVSHGMIAVFLFVGFFVAVTITTLRRTDRVGLAYNTVLLVSCVELMYYGVVPYGLPLMMVAVALAMRTKHPWPDKWLTLRTSQSQSTAARPAQYLSTLPSTLTSAHGSYAPARVAPLE